MIETGYNQGIEDAGRLYNIEEPDVEKLFNLLEQLSKDLPAVQQLHTKLVELHAAFTRLRKEDPETAFKVEGRVGGIKDLEEQLRAVVRDPSEQKIAKFVKEVENKEWALGRWTEKIVQAKKKGQKIG